MYIGDFARGSTVNFKFTTRSFSTGAPTTLAGTPVISIYIDDSLTQITTGVTLSVDFDSVTGLNNVKVDTSNASYLAGSSFQAVITTGTVGGVSVVGETIGAFSLDAVSSLRPTVAGRTLDVTATGAAGIDLANVENQGSTLGLTATTVAAVTTVTNLTNAPTVGDLTATMKASVTTAATAATPVAASVTGNIGGNVNGNVVGSVGSVVGAVGSVTGAVGSVTGNVGGNVSGSVGSVTGNLGGNVVGNVNGNVAGTVASVVGNVGGNVTGSVASVVGNVGGNVTGTVASVVGNVGGDVAGNVSGNVVGSVGSVVGLTASNLDATISSRATPAQILTTALTEAYAADGASGTLAQLLFGIQAFLQERTVVGVTQTVKKLDGSTTAMTFTLNSATTPTSITRAT